MAYYWVNQGQSFSEALESETFWAPFDRSKNLAHWNVVNNLRPGDIVFSHVNREIVAISYVTDHPIIAPQPERLARRGLWVGNGFLVRAAYQVLERPISLLEFQHILQPLMPHRHSPMTKTWTATQGYMFAIGPRLGRAILQLAQFAEMDQPSFHTPAEDTFTHYVVQTGGSQAQELRESRRGRGRFRSDVLNFWEQQCSVTKFEFAPLLYASHIKPWADSNNAERTDPHNGLLLTPSLHATFHRGLITFAEDGEIVISEALTPMHLTTLGVLPGMQLRSHPEETSHYLAHHREHVFQDGGLAYRGGYS